jgi:hypothetical protein
VVASLDTGEVIVQSDLDLQRPGPVMLLGDLLILGPPWSDPWDGDEVTSSRATIIDLSGSQPRVEGIDQVVAALPLYDGGWVPFSSVEPQTTGMALLLRTDDAYAVRVLDPLGEERWERSWEVPGDDCCWSVYPGMDGRSLMVVPSSDGRDPARVLSTDDGETLQTFALPAGDQRSFVWMDPVMFSIDHERGQGVLIAGPGGRFSATDQGGAWLHSVDDGVLVISLGRSYVGLDLAMLSGGS